MSCCSIVYCATGEEGRVLLIWSAALWERNLLLGRKEESRGLHETYYETYKTWKQITSFDDLHLSPFEAQESRYVIVNSSLSCRIIYRVKLSNSHVLMSSIHFMFKLCRDIQLDDRTGLRIPLSVFIVLPRSHHHHLSHESQQSILLHSWVIRKKKKEYE